MNKINRIMVVINGTENSYYAEMYSIYLKSILNSELYGIYVINEKALNDLLKANIFLSDEKMDYEKDMENDAERYLGSFKEMGSRKNITVDKTIIKKGIVHTEILKAIDENNIDLLIIGDLRRIISLRDIAYDEMEQVLRESHIPVLVVKKEEKIEMLYKNL